MHCPRIFPKTFNYNTLKKPYENPPACHKACGSRARPPVEKIKAQVTVSDDPIKLISEILTLPHFHPPAPRFWFQFLSGAGVYVRDPLFIKAPYVSLLCCFSF